MRPCDLAITIAGTESTAAIQNFRRISGIPGRAHHGKAHARAPHPGLSGESALDAFRATAQFMPVIAKPIYSAFPVCCVCDSLLG